MALPRSRAAHCSHHYREPPEFTGEDGAPTWITRGVNLVVAVTHVRAGTVLGRVGQPDEYMVLFSEGTAAIVEAGHERVRVEGACLVIAPPGDSAITATAEGIVARFFSDRAADLMAAAGNSSDYADGYETAVLRGKAWPDPVGGYRIRHYELDAAGAAGGPRIQPRVYRSTNLIINAFVP